MTTYILMNKNTPVLAFEYDQEIQCVCEIAECFNLKFAPPAILDSEGNATRKLLNNWWQNRAIPASRNYIRELLDSLNIATTVELIEKNFGLSLSDRYWINDSQLSKSWEEINFFDNDFSDDLGKLTLRQNMYVNCPDLMSPNSTLVGYLNKKWECFNDKRVLLKSGTGYIRQEVINELMATKLYERVLNPSDFVPYILIEENGIKYSACENMLKEDEELIAAYDIICNKKKPEFMNDYQFLVSCYKELGLKDVEASLAKMFTCDFILANADRHWRNFGVIRNVETLEYTRIAPIFDNGNSLWCTIPVLELETFYRLKPFGSRGMLPEQQLDLLSSFDWLDCSKLEGFTEEVKDLLKDGLDTFQAEACLSDARIDMIAKKVDRNISFILNKLL